MSASVSKMQQMWEFLLVWLNQNSTESKTFPSITSWYQFLFIFIFFLSFKGVMKKTKAEDILSAGQAIIKLWSAPFAPALSCHFGSSQHSRSHSLQSQHIFTPLHHTPIYCHNYLVCHNHCNYCYYNPHPVPLVPPPTHSHLACFIIFLSPRHISIWLRNEGWGDASQQQQSAEYCEFL